MEGKGGELGSRTHPVNISSAEGRFKFSVDTSMGFQFVFPAPSTKAEYVNDSSIKTLQFNTH